MLTHGAGRPSSIVNVHHVASTSKPVSAAAAAAVAAAAAAASKTASTSTSTGVIRQPAGSRRQRWRLRSAGGARWQRRGAPALADRL